MECKHVLQMVRDANSYKVVCKNCDLQGPARLEASLAAEAWLDQTGVPFTEPTSVTTEEYMAAAMKMMNTIGENAPHGGGEDRALGVVRQAYHELAWAIEETTKAIELVGLAHALAQGVGVDKLIDAQQQLQEAREKRGADFWDKLKKQNAEEFAKSCTEGPMEVEVAQAIDKATAHLVREAEVAEADFMEHWSKQQFVGDTTAETDTPRKQTARFYYEKGRRDGWRDWHQPMSTSEGEDSDD